MVQLLLRIKAQKSGNIAVHQLRQGAIPPQVIFMEKIFLNAPVGQEKMCVNYAKTIVILIYGFFE